MTGSPQGQGAIVTGGARGIGLGIARRLAAEGARVAIWDRGPDAVDGSFAPAVTETDLFREMTPEHIAAMTAKIPMGCAPTIPEIAATAAWIAGPECSFAFDLTGGRATYQGKAGEEVSSLDPPLFP